MQLSDEILTGIPVAFVPVVLEANCATTALANVHGVYNCGVKVGMSVLLQSNTRLS